MKKVFQWLMTLLFVAVLSIPTLDAKPTPMPIDNDISISISYDVQDMINIEYQSSHEFSAHQILHRDLEGTPLIYLVNINVTSYENIASRINSDQLEIYIINQKTSNSNINNQFALRHYNIKEKDRTYYSSHMGK